MVVGEVTETFSAGVFPTSTLVTLVKLLPVIVIGVPPDSVAVPGETPVIVGNPVGTWNVN